MQQESTGERGAAQRIGAGDRLRLTLSTTDTPHLTPLPEQLLQLAGGIYTIARSAAAPSSLTVDLLRQRRRRTSPHMGDARPTPSTKT